MLTSLWDHLGGLGGHLWHLVCHLGANMQAKSQNIDFPNGFDSFCLELCCRYCAQRQNVSDFVGLYGWSCGYGKACLANGNLIWEVFGASFGIWAATLAEKVVSCVEVTRK